MTASSYDDKRPRDTCQPEGMSEVDSGSVVVINTLPDDGGAETDFKWEVETLPDDGGLYRILLGETWD